MSNVIYIAARRHQDQIGALRDMLKRAEQGEIGDLFFLMEDLTTGEHVEGYVGDYRDNPGLLGQRLAALAVHLMGLQARIDGRAVG